jgi:hypothetical protein
MLKVLGYTQSQGGNPIPPSTNLTSIPTYTNTHVTTTIQPTRNVNNFLGISIGNSLSFVLSNLISPNPSPLTNLQYSCPLHTYTTPPYSPQSHNTNSDPILDTLLQNVSSLQQKIATLNQNKNEQPSQYIKTNHYL